MSVSNSRGRKLLRRARARRKGPVRSSGTLKFGGEPVSSGFDTALVADARITFDGVVMGPVTTTGFKASRTGRKSGALSKLKMIVREAGDEGTVGYRIASEPAGIGDTADDEEARDLLAALGAECEKLSENRAHYRRELEDAVREGDALLKKALG